MREGSDRGLITSSIIRRSAALSVVLLAVWSSLAPVAIAESPYELNGSREYVWMGAGAALWAGGFFAGQRIDPLTTAELQALDKNDVNSFDRGSMHPYRSDHSGNALVAASILLPTTFLFRDDMRDDAGTLAAMWVEATAWSQGLVAVTKSITQRTRPYVYYSDTPEDLKTNHDARLSFFSGHAAMAATNCFFMAKVFSDYSSNRNAEVAMWSGAVIIPALTGFFRVDSGHHFATDAIAGFVVGAAAGYLVPVLHHRDNSGVSLEPESNSGGLGFTATFSF